MACFQLADAIQELNSYATGDIGGTLCGSMKDIGGTLKGVRRGSEEWYKGISERVCQMGSSGQNRDQDKTGIGVSFR